MQLLSRKYHFSFFSSQACAFEIRLILNFFIEEFDRMTIRAESTRRHIACATKASFATFLLLLLAGIELTAAADVKISKPENDRLVMTATTSVAGTGAPEGAPL